MTDRRGRLLVVTLEADVEPRSFLLGRYRLLA